MERVPENDIIDKETAERSAAEDGARTGAGVPAGSGAVPPKRRKPLRLPFDGRSQDAGGWAYDHRIGLSVTIIVYLLLGIAFISSKIVIHGRSSTQGMIVDLKTLEMLEDERDRLEKEVRRNNANIDWKSIRNLSSNENALNENLKDDRGTNTASLNESADEVERRMRSNREAYERGVAEARAIGENRPSDTPDGEHRDRKIKGTVTVSYSFTDPVRYSRRLIKPAYRCEGGGEVVVNVVINQRGEVLSAQVVSGGDECMRRTALEAARGSVFDYNESAPVRQGGTITYVFIPQ